MEAAEPSGWEALPDDALTPWALADTRSPLSSLTFRAGADGLAVDGTLAADFPAVELRAGGVRAQAGLFAAAFMGFGAGGELTFDLYTFDGLFGAALDAGAGPWSARLHWAHLSAHWGDGVRKGDERPTNLDAWSREWVELTGVRELGPARLYLGGRAVLHALPAAAPFAVRVAAEAEGPWRVAPVAGVDLELAQEFGWSPALDVQAGLVAHAARSRFRAVLAGRVGPDDTGKLEGAPERWIGVQLGFDRTGPGGG